ncbi:TRAP transporter small permease [Enterovibrio makurazakiensis]|uniref:TRAP transporter small permease n=1 Tax=Enterovibrio makurazakiensis TaxID=2910232 RepID=UPI003D240166
MTLPNNIITTTKNRLNKANQMCVAILTTLLILDVWVGVLDRYVLKLQLVWVEEMARYLMIWAILMAVPCCTAGREHMGLEFVTARFPDMVQKVIKLCVGALTCAFFFYIAYLGYAFTEKGMHQLSTVFAMPMSYAYAVIPVTFALAGIQAFLVWLEDWYALKLHLSDGSDHLQGNRS